MDPDATLEELRELYNDWQDGNLDPDKAGDFVTLFDNLDNWIISGGFLPKEWSSGRFWTNA